MVPGGFSGDAGKFALSQHTLIPILLWASLVYRQIQCLRLRKLVKRWQPGGAGRK